MDNINEMDDDSEEIYTSGLLKRYSMWPAKLENITLADWAAWYDCAGKPYVKQTDEVDVDGLPLENCIDDNYNDDNDTEVQKIPFSKAKKRAKAKDN